ncbi:MAG: acetyl-CoA C-acyltransferase [Gammaproteobacteria bacterium]
MVDPVVIVGMARTALASFQGELASRTAPELGATAIRAALASGGIAADQVDETLMGCVLPAGMGQAPARQAALGAGIPDTVPCTTVNKMCGSGMKTVMLGHDALVAGSGSVIVAGGMESMTNAPYILTRMRGGMRIGHGQVYDHMYLDGLEDAYDKGRLMGVYAEDTARHYQFTREQQDAYAIESLARAQRAGAGGAFKPEIAPVTVSGKGGDRVVDADEQPRTARPDKIPTLKPAFVKDGTVTAANSSSISDGAAAIVLARATAAERLGVRPMARIVGHSSHAHAPAWFTTAPVGAIRKLLDKVGWAVKDVDLFEINEAFAVVAMAAMRDLAIDHARVNIRGGACALGHPIGASGARIIVTLVNALRDTGGRRGIASLCIGGGEATAVAVEIA